MKRRDRELGMHRRITRRDFIHGAGVAALGIPFLLDACGEGMAEHYYPPTT